MLAIFSAQATNLALAASTFPRNDTSSLRCPDSTASGRDRSILRLRSLSLWSVMRATEAAESLFMSPAASLGALNDRSNRREKTAPALECMWSLVLSSEWATRRPTASRRVPTGAPHDRASGHPARRTTPHLTLLGSAFLKTKDAHSAAKLLTWSSLLKSSGTAYSAKASIDPVSSRTRNLQIL